MEIGEREMEASVVAIWSVPVLLLVACGWGFHCNNRTYAARKEILAAAVPGRADFEARMAELRQVEYDRHMWALFFFRDPAKMYGPLARAVLAEAAS